MTCLFVLDRLLDGVVGKHGDGTSRDNAYRAQRVAPHAAAFVIADAQWGHGVAASAAYGASRRRAPVPYGFATVIYAKKPYINPFL